MKKTKNMEIIIFLCLITFMIISITSIKSASFILPRYYENFYIKQLSWYFLGFITIIITLIIGNDKIFKYSRLIYYLSIFLLIIVLFISPYINGSKAWINLGGFSFQPSELTKVGLILYIAKILNENRFKKKPEIKLLLKIFIIILVPSILVFLEPDTGAIFSYFIIAFVMLFIYGISKKWYLILISFIMLIIISCIFIFNYNPNFFIQSFGSNIYYRIERIINWRTSSGMQLENSLITIASSGLNGNTINDIPLYFPEPHTDFIFTVFVNIHGFIGVLLSSILLIIFNIRIIYIAFRSSKMMNKYIISGVIGTLMFYQIQNISMTIGLMPITGVPLPFISYGGSSLLIYMFLLGIIINAYKKK